LTYLVYFSRCTLLVVFAAAVVGKVQSRSAWAAFVAATGRLLDVRGTGEVWAAVVLLFEGTTVGCLALDRTTYGGLTLSLVGLSIFLLVVLRGVIRGVQTDCNCFGASGTNLGWAHVWRNAMLVGVAAIGTGAATAADVPSTLAGAAYATPIVLGFITAGLLIMWDDVTYLIAGE
jgi:hypothetical protein